MAKLSVHLLAAGKIWLCGEEVPDEIIPRCAHGYVVDPQIGRSPIDPESDLPGTVLRERRRVAREKPKD